MFIIRERRKVEKSDETVDKCSSDDGIIKWILSDLPEKSDRWLVTETIGKLIKLL